ncbi:MAG: glycosyltransferase family 39 protein [Ardenticatenaceae bacterium]|nr:glycosyltransferase family 39 protein [Ardenticatenaceae bacterium]
MAGNQEKIAWMTRPLALILLTYVALGTAFSLVVPLNEAPDEPDHFAYVRVLAQTARLPIMSPIAAENETMEANQPPLFYALNVLVAGWWPLDEAIHGPLNSCFSIELADAGRQTLYRHDPTEAFPFEQNRLALAYHLSRIFSVLLGGGTVWITYHLGRAAGLKEPFSLLGAGLVAFNPQFVFINGSVNNDVLTALLGAAIIWQAAVYTTRPSQKRLIGLGILFGLGLLTKYALIAYGGVIGLAILWPIFTDFQTKKQQNLIGRLAWEGFLFSVPVMVIAGWFYWHNWQLYGDPLVWDVHLQAKGAAVVRQSPFVWTDLLEFARWHFISFWAVFGWLNIAAPNWVYVIYAAISAVGIMGAAGIMWRKRGLLSPSHWLIGCAVLLIYLSLLRYIQIINWSGYQGRLAFAAVAPIAVILAAGWQMLFPRRFVKFLLAGLAGLVLSLLVGVVAPAYPRPQIYSPPTTAQAVCMRTRSGLLLDGVSGDQRITGGAINLTWHGLGMIGSEGAGTLETILLLPDGTEVGREQNSLNWRADELIDVPVQIQLPADLPRPTVLYAAAQLRDENQGELIEFQSATGRVLEAPHTAVELILPGKQDIIAEPQIKANALFGQQLQLIGATITAENIILVWEGASSIDLSYTTFVHVIDDDGNMLSQADSQPLNGRYPTRVWDVEERVVDIKSISVQDESTTLRIGVYHLATGQNLILPDGREWVEIKLSPKQQ